MIIYGPRTANTSEPLPSHWGDLPWDPSVRNTHPVYATDTFAGIQAQGTYRMTMVESGNTLGSPATVTISVSSR